jgi:thiol-disulfide isomerase/thioredoxin
MCTLNKYLIILFLISVFTFGVNPYEMKNNLNALNGYVFANETNDSTSKESFQAALKQDKPVVVKFFSEWCSTCHYVAPIYAKTKSNYSNKASFFEIDVDKYPDLSDEFEVMYIPTIYVIDPETNKMVYVETSFLSSPEAFEKKLDLVSKGV